ncbi:MAG: ParB N-terminal domain-containing protein [Oscillospiraceae bacterium]|nr:ParB N-terminal domain-containing protein [Oscillospiraceae bacterium]
MSNEYTGFKLKSMKDIFAVTDPASKSKNDPIYNLPLDKIYPFKNHPFKIYEGERFTDMVESIKANGVIIPIVVRPIDDFTYEILSGHNRAEASKTAGLETIIAIIKEGLTEEEALLIVTETNLIQRSFADLSHSERAITLSMHHEAIKCQGKRTDLIRDIENIVNAGNIADSEINTPMAKKINSSEIVGNKYDLSKDTVARYLRINKLINPHKERLDNDEISIRAGVSLSYLSENEQEILSDVLCSGYYKIDMKKAEILRTASEKKPLTHEDIEQILTGKKKVKAPRPPAFKLKSKYVTKYFKPEQKFEDIESTIIKALEYYYAHVQAETEEVTDDAESMGDVVVGEADISEDDSG